MDKATGSTKAVGPAKVGVVGTAPGKVYPEKNGHSAVGAVKNKKQDQAHIY